MPIQAIFAIVFIGLSLVYMVWMKGKTKQSLENARPAFHAFFERTGYRYADIAEQPVQAQVDRAYHDAAHPNPSGNVDLHYVRDFHGVRVHYRSKTWVEREAPAPLTTARISGTPTCRPRRGFRFTSPTRSLPR